MMRNNKLYKILRITFLILAIVSMTFTIFYKVGHCASSDNSNLTDQSSIPIAVSFGYGFNPNDWSTLSQTDVVPILHAEMNNHVGSGNYRDAKKYFFYEFDSSNNRITFVCVFERTNQGSSNGLYPSLCYYDSSNNTINYEQIYKGYITLNMSDLTVYDYRETFQNLVIPVNTFTNVLHHNTALYPFFVNSELYDDNSVQIYKHLATSSSRQDSIDDIDEGIEDSSQLPQVDDNSPSDPTTNNFLKKLLSALKTINSTIGGVGISIIDHFKQLISSIGEYSIIKQFYEDYNNIRNTSSSDVVSAFQGTIIYTTYSNIRSDISSFLNMFNVTPASSAPTWKIPLNGTVLYNQNYPNIVIDFGFYDRFRNTVSNILVAILTCSCVFNIIRSIPDIITGASGDESS